jgi:peroxiredoxin (alkyl hydroperoxide reductase subunit C)
MTATAGRPAPPFSLPDQNRTQVSLASLSGSKSLVVFIPFAFTSVCEGELCTIRDAMPDLDARVVAITCDTAPVNRKWAAENGFTFPVLSDFWPHGEVTTRYGAFNRKTGAADRETFVVDASGIVRARITSDSLGMAREFDEYREALSAI